MTWCCPACVRASLDIEQREGIAVKTGRGPWKKSEGWRGQRAKRLVKREPEKLVQLENSSESVRERPSETELEKNCHKRERM
mmetsp:Transcript_30991/g.61109  ORF Transcript_30991/g.61109 Transcript_30991/m.61109 type:complete len:82 (-) Transcript_30991:35-280(-)